MSTTSRDISESMFHGGHLGFMQIRQCSTPLIFIGNLSRIPGTLLKCMVAE